MAADAVNTRAAGVRIERGKRASKRPAEDSFARSDLTGTMMLPADGLASTTAFVNAAGGALPAGRELGAVDFTKQRL